MLCALCGRNETNMKTPTTFEEARSQATTLANGIIKKYPQLKGNLMIPLVWKPKSMKIPQYKWDVWYKNNVNGPDLLYSSFRSRSFARNIAKILRLQHKYVKIISYVRYE
jgi:hypothetical protein